MWQARSQAAVQDFNQQMIAKEELWRGWAHQLESFHKENKERMRQLEEEAFTERYNLSKRQHQQQVEDERKDKERLEREKSEMEERLMNEKQADRDVLEAELASLKVSHCTPDHLRPC